MSTFGKQYLTSLPGMGQDSILREDPNAFNNNFVETGNQLNTGVGAGYLALSALQPVVLNNLDYAPEYIKTAENFNAFSEGVDAYNKLQMFANMTDNPRGGGQKYFGETFSLGNLFETGATLGIAGANPIAGLIMTANALSQDEDSEYGDIPIARKITEAIDKSGDWLNDTLIGEWVRDGSELFYDKLLEPVIDTKVGKAISETAQLPLAFVDTIANLLGEGYEYVDKTFFGNYLPGGADNEDPESLIWSNPTGELKKSLLDIKDLFVTEERKEANTRYEKLPDITKNLIDDMVETGVPFQLAVQSISDPSVLQGRSELWTSDYGRKVAEIEYGQENIDRFKEWAKDPHNNPFLNHSDIYSGTKLPDDFVIDPTTFLAKPIDINDVKDQSKVDLNMAFDGNQGDLKKMLGEYYIEPDVLDIYNGVQSATLDGAERFVDSGFKDTFSREWTNDGDLYWIGEYSGYNEELAQETLDFIEGNAKTASEAWLERKPVYAQEVRDEQFTEQSWAMDKKARNLPSREGKYYKVGGSWGYYYSESPGSPAQRIIEALANNRKGSIDMGNGGKFQIDDGPNTSNYDWYDIGFKIPAGYTILASEPYIRSGAKTKQQKLNDILDQIPEYTYQDVLEMGQDGRKDSIKALLAKYNSVKDGLGVDDETAKQMGLSIKTIANKSEFDDFAETIARDLTIYKLQQTIDDTQIGDYTLQLPDGIDTILSRVDNNIMQGNDPFSDYLGQLAWDYADANDLSDYVFSDYENIDTSFYEPTSTEDLFNDYQQGFVFDNSTDMSFGGYSFGILPDTIADVSVDTAIQTEVNNFVDWLYSDQP